jgi:2,3-bisphosphoglycerate-dependent phosphoglycerate mutase
MYKLVLLRHGESRWNFENRFTGWTNINLTLQGIDEAKSSGQLLKANKLKFNQVYTSVLNRAVDTMKICLDQMELNNISIKSSWRLNERHYGALQGLNKLETAKKFGNKQVLIWRRSYDVRPPPLEIDDKRHPRFDKQYINLAPSNIPNSESLRDTINRLMPFWHNIISPSILSGKSVLIVAHGNSLRAIIKYLDKISDENIINLNIPTGSPIVYELDKKLNPIKHDYLDNHDNY